MGIATLLGIIGNISFGFKSLSQVIKCYKAKSTSGLSSIMIIMDFIGNISCTLYIFLETGFTVYWQFVNYGLATLFLVILIIMKFIYKN